MKQSLTIRNFLLIAILAVVLGLGVMIWTHRREPVPEPPADSPPANAGLFLRDIDYTRTSDGVRRWRLTAESAAYDAEQGESAVRDLRLRFFDKQGREQMVLTAREGFWRSERGEIEARGDVVIKTSDGYGLYTDQLLYRADRDLLSTDKVVRVESADLKLTARGMQYALKSRSLKLHSHVKAVLAGGIRNR